MKRILILIYLLSLLIGLNFTTPVFAAFCNARYQLDGSAITTLFACFSLSVFLFEIPTGVVSDRLGEKSSLVVGSLLYLISMMLFLSGNRALLYLGEFVFGMGSTFFSGPYDSIMYKYCRMLDVDGLYDEVVSKSYALQWLALGSSFLGCYILTSIGSYTFAFVGTACANMLLLIVALSLPTVSSEYVDGAAINETSIVKISKDVWRNRRLLQVVVLNTLFATMLTAGYLILQPYLLESAVEVDLNGVIYFVAAICACLGSLLYKRLSSTLSSVYLTIVLSVAAIAACMFGLWSSAHVASVVMLICIYRMIWGISAPLFSSLVNRSIEDDSHRNTCFSLISFGTNLCVALLLFGFSLAQLSARMEYLALGFLALLFGSAMAGLKGKVLALSAEDQAR